MSLWGDIGSFLGGGGGASAPQTTINVNNTATASNDVEVSPEINAVIDIGPLEELLRENTEKIYELEKENQAQEQQRQDENNKILWAAFALGLALWRRKK